MGKVFNYSAKRGFGGALLFYICHVILVILIAFVLGAILGAIFGQSVLPYTVRIGTVVAIVASLYITYMLYQKKGLSSNFANIVLILLAGVLAIFGGAILGLIPAAYLSTKGK